MARVAGALVGRRAVRVEAAALARGHAPPEHVLNEALAARALPRRRAVAAHAATLAVRRTQAAVLRGAEALRALADGAGARPVEAAVRAGVDAVARQVVHLVAQAAAHPRRGAVAPHGAALGALGFAAAVAALGVAGAAAAHLHQVQLGRSTGAGLAGDIAGCRHVT